MTALLTRNEMYGEIMVRLGKDRIGLVEVMKNVLQDGFIYPLGQACNFGLENKSVKELIPDLVCACGYDTTFTSSSLFPLQQDIERREERGVRPSGTDWRQMGRPHFLRNQEGTHTHIYCIYTMVYAYLAPPTLHPSALPFSVSRLLLQLLPRA